MAPNVKKLRKKMIPEDEAMRTLAKPKEDNGPEEDDGKMVEGNDPNDLNQKIESYLGIRKTSAKSNARSRYPEWKRCVELRLGRVSGVYTGGISVTDDVQTEINPDWALTKTKTANLFSQVPMVRGERENKQFSAAISPFLKQMNYEIGDKRCAVGSAMEEVLNDAVNAAGIGGVLVGYAARQEDVEMPTEDLSHIPPQVVDALIKAKKIPTTTTTHKVSDMFYATRLSPTDLLWPAEFVRSNFDDADWLGREGKCPWAVGKVEFRLSDEDKDEVLAGDENREDQDLRSDVERAALSNLKQIAFTEIYYWRYRFDPEEKSFKAIWRIVWVKGKDKAVIHEPWDGQEWDPQTSKFIGATKFPLRILTLTYITDNPVPPSDSTVGRPQVNDMRRSRSQMFQNRERSTPLRWYDVNRVDPLIAQNLMRGTIQGMIPTQGDGSRSVGEIARASYPAEDLSFDQQVKQDLMEMWQIGPEQLGISTPGKKTNAQAGLVQQNFATRIGQERAKVANFFLGICEVLAGLMVLHSDFSVLTDQEKQQMEQAWDRKHVVHDLVFKILPDSTIQLDTTSRLNRAMQFLNMTVKSGFVNPLPVIADIAELSGYDPSEVIVQPKPPKPDDPNLSYRFSGKDDLMNPIVYAMLKKTGQAPSAEEIEAAKADLLAVQSRQPVPRPPQAGGGAAPGPSAPASHPPGAGATTDHHPQWALGNKIAKRSRDMSGGGQ